jgi:catechol 2,3-dioxygenase-like lactoylglutathione lyase family enzyme
MTNTSSLEIDLVQLVTVPTLDQSRSLAFYESLGFEVRADFPWGDSHRWIEVYPPGTSTGLVLMPAGPERVGIRTGIILNTGDIDAAYEHMKQLGVDVDAGIACIGSPVKIRIGAVEQTEPRPPMFWFRDPDENAPRGASSFLSDRVALRPSRLLHGLPSSLAEGCPRALKCRTS